MEMGIREFLKKSNLPSDKSNKYLKRQVVFYCIVAFWFSVTVVPIQGFAHSSFFLIEDVDAKTDAWVLIDEEDQREEIARQTEIPGNFAEKQVSQREISVDASDRKWF